PTHELLQLARELLLLPGRLRVAADETLAAEVADDLQDPRVVLGRVEPARREELLAWHEYPALRRLRLLLGGEDERLQCGGVGEDLRERCPDAGNAARAERVDDRLREPGEDLRAVPKAGKDVPMREHADGVVKAK